MIKTTKILLLLGPVNTALGVLYNFIPGHIGWFLLAQTIIISIQLWILLK